jgi:hypothetical protein
MADFFIFNTIRKVISGNQINMISEIITFNPHILRNDLSLIGETAMGVQGEKNLVLSIGESRAMPKPPFVKASRIPWLAPTAKRNKAYFSNCFENKLSCLKKIKHKKMLNIKEKKME